MVSTRSMVPYKRRRSSSMSSRNSRQLVPVSRVRAEFNVAKQLLNLTKKVRGITPEKKYFEQALSFVNIAHATGAQNAVCDVVQGGTQLQRIGNKIRVKRIQVFCQVTQGSMPANPQSDTYIRFFVVQDLQCISDTEPTPAAVFNDPSFPQAPWFNLANQGRFKILHYGQLMEIPRLTSTSTPVATALNQAPTQMNYYRCDKRVDIPITYNGSSGGDIQKNPVFVMVTTNLTADTIDASGLSRITFLDD